MKKPSKKALRALDIIANNRLVSARDFAERMWPRDDPRYQASWERVHNCGNYGATSGAPMWMLGGRYLRYLERAGFVVIWNPFHPYDRWSVALTSEGRFVLKGETNG